MRREIIQDFLNVPGIVGVALMGGASTPYFRGFEAEHRPQFSLPQQLTIAQNIQQVLETIPEGFNSFEFQFDGYRAYLHKLNRGTTLLVLTLNHLARLTYTQAVRRLLIELQIDQADPISEFRALALDMLPLQPAEPAGQPPPLSHPDLGPELSPPSRLTQRAASSSQSAVSPPAEPLRSEIRSEIRNQPSPHQPQPATNGTGHAGPKPSGIHPSTANPADTNPTPKPTPNQQNPLQSAPSPSPTGATSNLVAAEAASAIPTGVPIDADQSPQAHGLAGVGSLPGTLGLPSSKQAVQPTPVQLTPVQPIPAQPASPRQADVNREELDREELDREELDREGTESVPDRAKPDSQSASLKDVLAAINRLSQFTSQYLGTLVVSNYWKATCPAEAWLSHFQIERSAQMTFAVQIPSQPLPILTAKQHQCLKNWVAAFLERCSKVMRNFGKIVRQALTPQELALLFD